MWIIYWADDSHEMSSLTFSENKKKKLIVVCSRILSGALKVNSGLLI